MTDITKWHKRTEPLTLGLWRCRFNRTLSPLCRSWVILLDRYEQEAHCDYEYAYAGPLPPEPEPSEPAGKTESTSQSGPQLLTLAEVKKERRAIFDQSDCQMRFFYQDVLTAIARGASHAQALAKAALGEE